jgi:hypothetical protein|tara:strand:- start:5343 stop:6251 length:909 start_codon:yes stop_codon:yes gene_type:complete
MSFANLKRDRGQINKLVAAAEAAGGGATSNKYTDDRMWKPTVDKQNNGYAVIRFLPATEGAELPWVRYWDHGFKGPTGKWYIEKSLTSIGQEDPVGELNSKLWNTGLESDKETARRQKRRLHHVSNILVVSDPGNPANEGKVFLYQYGKKIFDKLMDAMQPDFADEEPINPFDFWTGANFKLKIRDVEGYRNYDKSEFSRQEALSEDDAKLEGIYNSMHDLNKYAEEGYKSYAELKTKLMSVLGEAAVGGAPTMAQERSLGEERPAAPIKAAPAPQMTAVASSEANDDDDIMSHFANLVNED